MQGLCFHGSAFASRIIVFTGVHLLPVLLCSCFPFLILDCKRVSRSHFWLKASVGRCCFLLPSRVGVRSLPAGPMADYLALPSRLVEQMVVRRETYKPPCKFWRQGWCQKGKKCKLNHGQEDDATSSIKLPYSLAADRGQPCFPKGTRVTSAFKLFSITFD